MSSEKWAMLFILSSLTLPDPESWYFMSTQWTWDWSLMDYKISCFIATSKVRNYLMVFSVFIHLCNRVIDWKSFLLLNHNLRNMMMDGNNCHNPISNNLKSQKKSPLGSHLTKNLRRAQLPHDVDIWPVSAVFLAKNAYQTFGLGVVSVGKG